MEDRLINHSLYGLRVTQFCETDLIAAFDAAIREGRQRTCYGYSLTLLPRFRTMPQIHTIAETFDIMVADGKGFYLLCKMFGVPLDSDWAIYEVADALLALADKNKYSVMLLGADRESNRIATENLRLRYPNAVIVEGRDGYYTVEEEPSVVERINALKPDILMIGISSPKKEEFVWRRRDQLKPRIIVPMGGVIDIYAGKTRPIPPAIKQLSLSWLYRFAQEPKRTRAILINALDVLFRLIPAMVWAKWIRRNSVFSIPGFYGVEDVEPPRGAPH